MTSVHRDVSAFFCVIVFSAMGLRCSSEGLDRHCGRGEYDFENVIPGPGEPGFDEALEAKAWMYDRQFHGIHTYATGMSCDLTTVPLDSEDERKAIISFVRDSDSWDFKTETGFDVTDVISAWHKATGAYAGAGIAADAYRYGVLRDQGYDCKEVERAREILLKDLDALHVVKAITGTPGVIARAVARKDLPGDGQVETVPLFDENGNPLPEEKNNGTWREDNSGGKYPDLIWEDSCSRDMYIGWTLAFGAAHEVIKDDPAIEDSYRQRLAEDALDLAKALQAVHQRESGDFDLEIPDADGRTTYHGYMNENNLDRLYLPGVDNGFYAIMALGIVATFADVSGDSGVRQYLDEELIKKRKLHEIARDHMITVDVGVSSNYSNYNMAFDGAWLALRHLHDESARRAIMDTVRDQLYDNPHRDRQPVEQKQTLYDLVWAVASVDSGDGEMDRDAVERGLETLHEFWEPPFFPETRINCDQEELESGKCIGIDGTVLDIHPDPGRGGKPVSIQPVPMRIRPASNYYWRSNPYLVNGEGENRTSLFPAVDFRFAYWMGRWARK